MTDNRGPPWQFKGQDDVPQKKAEDVEAQPQADAKEPVADVEPVSRDDAATLGTVHGSEEKEGEKK